VPNIQNVLLKTGTDRFLKTRKKMRVRLKT
jgi:hypothetical protein